MGRPTEGQAPADDTYLILADLFVRFGISDPPLTALRWHWWGSGCASYEEPNLDGVFLVNASNGARVPLSEVARLIGHELTREGLVALGFLSDLTPNVPSELEAALIDAKEAAALMGINEAAFRQRVQRGQIPRAAIVRTGKRQQFVRSKLPGLGSK